MIEEQLIIELARSSDAYEISLFSRKEIEYGLGWSWNMRKIVEKIRSDSCNVVVAKMNQTVVGFGIMKYVEDYANLDLLGVKKEYRRLGVATQIVLWLEKVALYSGIRKVIVQVREDNKGGMRFYDNLGYNISRKVPGYYRGKVNAYVLSKRIGADLEQ